MAIIVKSGTVLSAHGKVTIDKGATIQKGADIGKNVKRNKSSSSKKEEKYSSTSSPWKQTSPITSTSPVVANLPANNPTSSPAPTQTQTQTETSNYVRPQSDVRPSTKKEKRALRRASFAEKTGIANFIEGATGMNRGAPNPFAETSTPAQSLGAAAGGVFSIVSSTGGANVFRGAKVVTRTIGAPIRAVGQAVVKGAPAGLKGVTGALYTMETSYAAGKLGYGVVKATRSKESKAFINTGEAKKSYEAANTAALEGKGKAAQYVASNIPGGKRIVDYDNMAFDRSVKDYATTKGYNPDVFSQSVKDYGKARKTGTTAAILTGNTASESVGSALFASNKAFTTGQTIPIKGAFGKLFFQGAKVTAMAGAGEGAGIVLGSEAATGKSLQQTNFLNVGIGAVGGALTAGALGGTIYATSILKPGISKGLLGAAYITEPAEYFGDVAGGVSSAGVIKTKGALTFTSILSNTKSKTKSKSRTRVPTPTNSLLSTPTNTPTTTPTDTLTPTPTPTTTPSNIKNDFFTPTDTPVSPPTNTPVNTPTPTPTPTPAPTQTPSFTNTLVNTLTPTNTYTNTYTPTYTTTSKLPFMPLLGGSNKQIKPGFGDFFKQNRGYNPSLFSSVLNIKGSKTSDYGLKSGLGIRKITKGRL